MNRWIIGLLLALGLGWAMGQNQPKPPQIRSDINSPRFQIVINPSVRADTFLLDTVTGKVWVRTTFTNIEGDPDVWRYQEKLDDASAEKNWTLGQTFKPSKPLLPNP